MKDLLLTLQLGKSEEESSSKKRLFDTLLELHLPSRPEVRLCVASIGFTIFYNEIKYNRLKHEFLEAHHFLPYHIPFIDSLSLASWSFFGPSQ